MSELTQLFDELCEVRVANDIVTALEEASSKQIECDFHLNEGVMAVKEIENKEIAQALAILHGKKVYAANTWYAFDTKLNSMLGFVKDTVCKLMAKGDMTDADFGLVSDFIPRVLNRVNTTPELLDRIRVALRKLVLNNDDSTLFPMKETRLLLWEFGEKEDYGDVIKIFSYKTVNAQTGKYTTKNEGIAQDLIQRRRQAGYKRDQNPIDVYAAIILEQKAANNPLYAEILPEDVVVVSEARDCHLDFFVDYSPASKEAILARAADQTAAGTLPPTNVSI